MGCAECSPHLNDAKHTTPQEVFGVLVNKDVMDRQRTSAELMAAFVNRLLAKGGEKLTDAEVEAYSDKVCVGVCGAHIARLMMIAFDPLPLLNSQRPP